MIMTSTVLPILCLMDWHSPKCRLNAPPPRFAPNYDVSRAQANALARTRAKSAVRAGHVQQSSTHLTDLTFLDSSDNQIDGFFTPILPSAASTPRRAVHSKGESTSTRPITVAHLITPAPSSITSASTVTSTLATTTSTTLASTTTSTITTTAAFKERAVMEAPITTTNEPPRVIRLPDYNPTGHDEVITMATKPLGHTTRAVPGTAMVTPRPHEGVHVTARQNPDHLGDSIWANIDVLPEPMVTGPLWTFKNTTRFLARTTTPKITTTTVQKTEKTWPSTAQLKKTTATTMKSTFAEKSTAATFSTFLSATTAKLAKSRTTPSFTVYPVRPTTPMGDLVTTTMKVSEAADFPRTALISVASVSVIMVIAIVVFCVFRCRQNPPPSDHYPMVCNGKTQQGYTSIAPELSPPLGADHVTQPLLGRPAPQMNGYGYQSMKADIITNNNVINGHVKNGGVGKKDFKEWYV